MKLGDCSGRSAFKQEQALTASRERYGSFREVNLPFRGG